MDMKINNIKRIIARIILIELLIFINCICVYFIKVNKEISNNSYLDNINNVVEIYSNDDDLESFGSGWFIDDDIIVTNYHVVSYLYQKERYKFSNISIRFFDETEYIEVSIIKYDESKDIVFLEYKGDHKHTFYQNNIIPETGEKCFILGNFNNYGLSYREGSISLAKVNLNYNDVNNIFIQCDISIGQGDSGALLINKDNQLIGMITFRTKSNSGFVEQGFAYAIPSSVIFDFLVE